MQASISQGRTLMMHVSSHFDTITSVSKPSARRWILLDIVGCWSMHASNHLASNPAASTIVVHYCCLGNCASHWLLVAITWSCLAPPLATPCNFWSQPWTHKTSIRDSLRRDSIPDWTHPVLTVTPIRTQRLHSVLIMKISCIETVTDVASWAVFLG